MAKKFPTGSLGKGKPPMKGRAAAKEGGAKAESHLDRVVKKFGGGYNPGRGK